MKNGLGTLILMLAVTMACGKAHKKKDAVHHDKTELTEEQFRSTFPDQKIDPPTLDPQDPTTDAKHPESKNDHSAPHENSETSKTSSAKPPGVGVLVTITAQDANNTYFDNCTATLINGNEIITAAHCVPTDKKSAAEYCSKMTFLHANESQPFACQEVIYSSVEENKVPIAQRGKNTGADILIFKLASAPTKIQSFSLTQNFTNVQDDHKVLVYSPNKMAKVEKSGFNLLSSIMRNTTQYFFANYSPCKITDGSAPGYPFRSFGCPIYGGNSGGPVFNSKNQLQGIIGGCLESKGAECAGEPEGYMTDVACLEKVDGKYHWKSSCKTEGTLHSKTAKANN